MPLSTTYQLPKGGQWSVQQGSQPIAQHSKWNKHGKRSHLWFPTIACRSRSCLLLLLFITWFWWSWRNFATIRFGAWDYVHDALISLFHRIFFFLFFITLRFIHLNLESDFFFISMMVSVSNVTLEFRHVDRFKHKWLLFILLVLLLGGWSDKFVLPLHL